MTFESPFAEIAAILLAAVAVGAVGTWLRQPLIVSFIVVGVLVGPAGAGWVTMHDQIELLAGIGISLLLFVVGLRLDIEMIRTVGPVALATGIGQVIFTSVIGFALATAMGFGLVPATYIAVTLTFSSTIIIVKLLSDKQEIDALHGRIAVGFLIVQDLAVIVALIVLTSLGPGPGGSGQGGAAIEMTLKGLAMLAGVAALMRWVLPWLTGHLGRSPELIVLFGTTWAVVLAAAGDRLGFSKEVGAFVAGVSLASTPYRDLLGARLVTVRDFLLLFFFIDLGARLDLSLVGATIGPSLVFSAFVLIGNPIIMMAIMGLMGYRKRTGFLAGLTVAQISEFSLILGALGVTLGHITPDTMGLITSVGLITIALSTYLIIYSGPLYERMAPWLGVFERKAPYREMGTDLETPPAAADVILFGLGRYGGGIARHLRLRNKRVIGVDFNPHVLARWRAEGLPVLYGDAADPELFERLPLSSAKWVVSTAPDVETSLVLRRHLLEQRYPGKLAVACRTVDEADVLRLEGVDVLLRPFADAAEQAVDAITSGMDRLSSVASATLGVREVRLGPGSMWAGRRLGQVPLRDEFGVTVLGVSRSGRSFFNPGPEFQLFPGDRLILSGEPQTLAAAVDYLARVDFPDQTEEERDFVVEEISLQDAHEWYGRTIAALDVRNRFGVSIVAIKHDDRLSAPNPQQTLTPNDRLVVAGAVGAISRLRGAFGQPSETVAGER